MDKNIEVDIAGYENQRKEEIIKTGQFIKLEIVIGDDDDEPYCHVENSGDSIVHTAKMIKVIDIVKKQLCKMYPVSEIYANVFLEADEPIRYDIEPDDEEKED